MAVAKKRPKKNLPQVIDLEKDTSNHVNPAAERLLKIASLVS